MPTLEIQVPERAKFLYEPYRYKALHGGRASGKSWSIANALIVKGCQNPIRWLFCREIEKSIWHSTYSLLVNRIEDMNLASAFVIKPRSIHCTNGTKFLFAGLMKTGKLCKNPNIMELEKLDGVWVQNADSCSQIALDILTSRVCKEGSEIWFSWNRNYTTDPVDKMFLGGNPPPESKVVEMNWQDNPWFPEVLKDDLEHMKKTDYEKYLHVWKGHPIR